jgi:hypothetical protein
MQALVIVLLTLVALAILAGRHGVDSRGGFDGSPLDWPAGPGLQPGSPQARPRARARSWWLR